MQRMSRRGVLAVCLGVGGIFAIGLGLAGCGKSPPSFENLDISDSGGFNTAFSLPDVDGRRRSLADYKGDVVVLFFGYTQCPDVCPTSLAELAEARKRLGEAGKRLQVVFVSVDPERDTPGVLAQYVAAFDPSFVALRPANDADVQTLAKQFHIYVGKSAAAGASSGAASSSSVSSSSTSSSSGPASYTIDHTAASFVFDPTGKLRLYARDGQGVDRWVHDVTVLLAGK
jgi:protein SCO1/2